MLKVRLALLTALFCLSPVPCLLTPRAAACPFCAAVTPTFAERRAEAEVLLLAEVETAGRLLVRQTLQGRELWGSQEDVETTAAGLQPGDLALLLGKRKPDVAPPAWSWEIVPVDETRLAYFVRAPSTKKPTAERLRYFLKYLEHSDREIAADAFGEFGRAPFEAVAAVADGFPYASLRAWLVDPNVAGEHKGFYGMALGLAPEGAERIANTGLLRKAVVAETSDFRAGFDGMLGGLLLAEGTAALDLIDERFLRNPQAAEGDVRHAQRALRFYLQYGRAIPEARLQKSVALLLDRPATAAEALQDLTRRKAWDYVDRAAALFTQSPGDDPALDRAVVSYLLVCPRPEAATALRNLKAAAPQRTAEALRRGAILGVRE